MMRFILSEQKEKLPVPDVEESESHLFHIRAEDSQ